MLSYQRYAWTVSLAGALLAAGAGIIAPSQWGWEQAATFTVLTALVLLSGMFPVRMSPQAEASMAAAPIFAAVVLLSPAQAAAAAGIGSFVTDVYLRRKPIVRCFNAGVAMAAASLSGFAFLSLAGEAPADLLDPAVVAAGLAAGAVMHATNLAAMIGMISFRKGLSFWSVWKKSWTIDALQEAGVVVLGFVLAALYREAWWFVFLLVTPLVMAYVALARSVKEAADNIKLAQDLEAGMKELRAAQAQLVQSAKMASVGTLAAGVAHEINNPLFVIMGKTELLLQNSDTHLRSDKARQYLASIHDQCDRAAQVVRELLAFSHEGSPTQEVEIPEVMDKAVRLVHEMRPEKKSIQVHRDYSEGMPPVLGASTKLQQVFVNLLQNSMDAMPDGGSIYIRCWSAPEKVCISMRDTGRGIPRESLERIFEPFFTTKEVGKGTGLGLYICHRIVTEHHGSIKVQSELGSGTEVIIEVPACPVIPREEPLREAVATAV